MQTQSYVVYPQDILLSLSNVVDLMHPALNEHHRYVAYIAYRIAVALGCNKNNIKNIVLASLLHDIGAFSEHERLSLQEFKDTAYPQVDRHAEIGYRLLCDFKPFAIAGHYVRFHHKSWTPTTNSQPVGIEVPIESHIIHLADRIAVLVRKDRNILQQTHNIRTQISLHKEMFAPALVEVFFDIAAKEEFWLNVLYEPMGNLLRDRLECEQILLDSDQFNSLVCMFRRIIDFRSIFTSLHSSGVAVTASILAKTAGFSPQEIHMINVAGHLHDMGKIAMPLEILEKPTTLTDGELAILRTHSYHTDRILRPIPFFDTIRTWAAQHHEMLNGNGYPFHCTSESISLGSRIIAIADIFTALTEDRPYRKGIPLSDTLDIMKNMVIRGNIDPEVYGWMCSNAHDINETRMLAQKTSQLDYKRFISGDLSCGIHKCW